MRPTYPNSQLLRNHLGIGPVRTKPLVSNTIGLRPKHSIAPPAKPTRSLMGRSGSNNCRKFLATNAFQLLHPTTPTLLVVNMLLTLGSLPIPARSGVRQPNFEATITNPINKAFCFAPTVGAKTFTQPTGLHVNKENLAAIPAGQVRDRRTQTRLLVGHALCPTKMPRQPHPAFSTFKSWFFSHPTPTTSLMNTTPSTPFNRQFQLINPDGVSPSLQNKTRLARSASFTSAIGPCIEWEKMLLCRIGFDTMKSNTHPRYKARIARLNIKIPKQGTSLRCDCGAQASVTRTFATSESIASRLVAQPKQCFSQPEPKPKAHQRCW